MCEPHNAGCLPIRFNTGGLPIVRCDDPTLAEQPLFERARRGEAVAQLWQAPQGFVVPGSYRKFANLAAVSDAFAARGWPVWMRRSGGGLVPQGPGILNLSLAWPVIQPLGEAAEPIYCCYVEYCNARFRLLASKAIFRPSAVLFATAAIIWPAVREKTRARLPVPLNTGGP